MSKIISRKEAKEKGLKRYFTGISCKNGHFSERSVSDKQCVECHKIRKNEWARNNPDKRREQDRRWRRKYPDKIKSRRLKIRYGITLADKMQIYETQGHKCAICREILKSISFAHIDHNHANKNIRGLLCQKCNHAIGLFRENPETLRRAIQYLGNDNKEKE